MASEHRWHHSACKRPNVAPIGGVPYCSSCSMVPVSQAGGDPNLDTPIVYDFDDLESPDEVRILQLSSGKPEDPLHGVLRRHRLEHFSGYETLSYTWACYNDENVQHPADYSKSRSIYLGEYWDAFPITQNCHNALRRLRDSGQPRLIWVDAICINQNNKKERGHQVDMMHRIYGNAQSVAVYLGAASADSDMAMQLLRDPNRLSDLSKVTSQELSSLAALFQRPYFARTWVVQEVALARSLRLYCGAEEIFVPAYSSDVPFWELIPSDIVPAWLKYGRRWNKALGYRLLSLIEDTRACRCSDPRDRVFALFGLVANSELVADYHLAVEQVYAKVATYIMQVDTWRALRVLDLASNSSASDARSSWVPDWSQSNIFELTSHLTQYRSYENPDQRVRSFLAELDLKYTGFWTPNGLLEPNSVDKSIPYLIFDQRQRTKGAAGVNSPDPRVSENARLSIRGIPLKFSSPPAILREHILVFHNQAHTALLLFEFRRSWPRLSDASHPILLWLPGNEIAILAPRESSHEFRLVGVSKAEIYLIEGGGTLSWLPELVKNFLIEPYSAEERGLLKGVLSQPSRYPCLGKSNHFWKVSPEDWLRDEVSVDVLLSDLCTEYYDKEMQLWRQWRLMQRRGQAIFWNRASVVSILNELRLRESVQDASQWCDTRSITGIQGSDSWIRRCFIADFLSLFITKPLNAEAKEDSSPQDGSENGIKDINGRLLNFLMDWAETTLRLMSHLTMIDKHPFLEHCSFPGLDVASRAAEVWQSHMAVAENVYSGGHTSTDSSRASWPGRYAEFMMRRIACQRFGNLHGVVDGDSGISLEGGSDVKYWDWAEMDIAEKKRQELWAALNQLRGQLKEECLGMSNLQASLIRMREKIGTQFILEEMGLQVGGLVDEIVTIQ